MGKILFSLVGFSLAAVIYISIYILFEEKILQDSRFNDSISYMSAAVAMIFVMPALSHNTKQNSASMARLGLAVTAPLLSTAFFGLSSYLCFTDFQRLWKVSLLFGGAVLLIGILLLMIVTIFTKNNQGATNDKL